LYARGVPLDGCFDVLNLNTPALVQAIHSEYIAAGADCIETNTFGANRFKLAVHGLGSQVREINLRGVKLARDVREAMGRDVLVLGSMGPLGKYLAPLGTLGEGEARDAFREQAEGLLEGGVDAFVVETMSDLGEVALAVEAIRAVADLPIVAEVAFTDEGLTFLGRTPAEVARTLSALAVQVVGANCSVGSSTLYEVLEQMRPAAGGRPIAIQPNAGLPSRVGERLIYLSSPARLGVKLAAGEFVVTVELDPPRGHNIEKLVQGAKLLKERGAEIVDINDGSLGRIRMAVLPTAVLVRDATGLEINMHFTCRV